MSREAPDSYSIPLLAPEEQYVYSSKFLDHPAPLGAECKLRTSNNMALRWSAGVLGFMGYKHGAPPEHFAP